MSGAQIDALIGRVQWARVDKDYARSDEIRGLLSLYGITMEEAGGKTTGCHG